MTEQEIVDQLATNEQKIVRSILDKLVNATDDSRLVEWYNTQEALREQLRQLRGQ